MYIDHPLLDGHSTDLRIILDCNERLQAWPGIPVTVRSSTAF